MTTTLHDSTWPGTVVFVQRTRYPGPVFCPPCARNRDDESLNPQTGKMGLYDMHHITADAPDSARLDSTAVEAGHEKKFQEGLAAQNEIPARWGSTDGADQSNSNARCTLLGRIIY